MNSVKVWCANVWCTTLYTTFLQHQAKCNYNPNPGPALGRPLSSPTATAGADSGAFPIDIVASPGVVCITK